MGYWNCCLQSTDFPTLHHGITNCFWSYPNIQEHLPKHRMGLQWEVIIKNNNPARHVVLVITVLWTVARKYLIIWLLNKGWFGSLSIMFYLRLWMCENFIWWQNTATSSPARIIWKEKNFSRLISWKHTYIFPWNKNVLFSRLLLEIYITAIFLAMKQKHCTTQSDCSPSFHSENFVCLPSRLVLENYFCFV